MKRLFLSVLIFLLFISLYADDNKEISNHLNNLLQSNSFTEAESYLSGLLINETSNINLLYERAHVRLILN